MALVGPEPSLVKCSIAVLEVSLTFQLIIPKLAYVKGLLLGKFEFTNTTADPVFPFTLVEVTIWPFIDSDPVRLVVIVVAKVHAFVGIYIAT